MEFTVNAREFLRAADPAIGVATKNITKGHDPAEKVTIKAEDSEVTLFAHGGGAAMIAPICGDVKYKCLEKGMITVNASQLEDAISSLPDGQINFKVKSGELQISLDDEDCSRSIPTFKDVVTPEKIGDKCVNKISLKRKVFLEGLKKVAFACAVEEKMYHYMCVVIDVSKEKVQFLAGSGSRFVVDQVCGTGILSFDKEGQIYLSKQNISNVRGFLSGSQKDDADVILKHIEANPSKAVPEQVTIELDGMTMCIYNVGQFGTFPKISAVLSHEYSNEVWFDLESWKMAVAGSVVTKRFHEGTHNTAVKLDRAKKRLIVESRTTHKSRTPIPIDLSECTFEDGDPWFKANTNFFEDMVSCWEGDRKVLMCFENQDTIEGIEDEEVLREKMKPVLVSYKPIPDTVLNTSESFYLFFVLSTK